MSLKWDPILETGVRAIDHANMALVIKINALNGKHLSMQSTAALDHELPWLLRQPASHFLNEEALLSNVAGGTEYEQRHLAQHREFVRQIQVQSQRRKEQGDGATVEILGWYLKDWLLNHIVKFDCDLGRRLHAKAALNETRGRNLDFGMQRRVSLAQLEFAEER